MRIIGVDFTSAPKRDKPIVVADCEADDKRLLLRRFLEFEDWPAYEQWLGADEEWVGGFDFPFGLPRSFVEKKAWPRRWAEMVDACVQEGKRRFVVSAMRAFQEARVDADKHRRTDLAARSHSPLKTRANPPVGLMFYEGAWRLKANLIRIPGLNEIGSKKIALEAFPGLLVARLGGRYYKNDKERSAAANASARRTIIEQLRRGIDPLSCSVVFESPALTRKLAHASGDWLDAVLCATQAHWGWLRRDFNFGLPADLDPFEGWIVSAERPVTS